MIKLQIITETPVLRNLVTQVSNAAGSQNTNAYYPLVHFELTPSNELIATALNGTFQLTAKASVQVKAETELTQSFFFTAECAKLNNLVKTLTADETKLDFVFDETKDEWQAESFDLKSGRSKYKMAGLEPSGFPFLQYEEENAITIQANLFHHLLNNVAFSMAKNDARYFLNGMKIEFNAEQKQLLAVATDGHRLAVSKLIDMELPQSQDVILPFELVNRLIALLKASGKSAIQLALDPRMIVVTFENDVKLIGKLIDGRFPDFNRVIPKRIECSYSVPRLETMAMLKRLALIADKSGKMTKVDFLFKNSEKILEITGKGSIETGVETTDIDVVTADSDKQELLIAFNQHYVADVLNATTTDSVELAFTDSNSPMLVKEKEEVDEKTVWTAYVVMPMKL